MSVQVADPDSFVILMPVTFELRDASAVLEEVYAETWFQEIEVDLAPSEGELLGQGQVRMPGAWTLDLAVEPPIEGLALSLPPDFAAGELALLEQHRSVYRVSVASKGRGQGAARRCAQMMSTFVTAGASAAVVPMTRKIHHPRFVQRETMDVQVPSLVNLFVSAWNQDDWMMSRGLTAFGLPEVETPIVSGMNDAYFRLLDVAANLVMLGSSFPRDAPLQIGHATFVLSEGAQGPADDQVPMAGHFGRLSIVPG